MTNTKKLKVSKNSAVNKNDSKAYTSAVCEQGFVGGVHYFEVDCPSTNEHPAKIGVTLNKDFDMESHSFSDFKFGYGFFQKGQLRHNSNAMGKKFGKDNKSKVGVIVNLSRGSISFMQDGNYLGVAFESP